MLVQPATLEGFSSTFLKLQRREVIRNYLGIRNGNWIPLYNAPYHSLRMYKMPHVFSGLNSNSPSFLLGTLFLQPEILIQTGF